MSSSDAHEHSSDSPNSRSGSVHHRREATRLQPDNDRWSERLGLGRPLIAAVALSSRHLQLKPFAALNLAARTLLSKTPPQRHR